MDGYETAASLSQAAGNENLLSQRRGPKLLVTNADMAGVVTFYE